MGVGDTSGMFISFIICTRIQAFIQTLKIFLYSRLKVFQRPVLEFALLCYEWPIETAMLNMEGTVCAVHRGSSFPCRG